MATNLGVKLTLDDNQYLAALTKAKNATTNAVKSMTSKSSGFGTLGKLAGLISVGAVIHKISEETREAQANQAKLASVIKSTGGAAGVSADQANQLAQKLSVVTAVDDDLIVGAEAVLLRFRNMSSEVFPNATKAALDLSAATGKDLTQSATMIGKAIQDPIKGMAALNKIGVSLTETQINQIKNFKAIGDNAGASKVVLDALNKSFGGTAQAIGNTFGGSLDRLKNALGNMAATVGEKLTPGFGEFSIAIADCVSNTSALGIAFEDLAEAGGDALTWLADRIRQINIGVTQAILWDKQWQAGLVSVAEAERKIAEARAAGRTPPQKYQDVLDWAEKLRIAENQLANAIYKRSMAQEKGAVRLLPNNEGGGGGGKSSQSKLPSLVDGSGLVPPFVAAGLNNSIAESLRKQADATKDLEEKTRLLEAAEKAELKVKSQIFDGVTSVINYTSNMVGAVDQLYAAQAQSQMDNLDKMKSNLDMYIDYSMQREMELAGVKEETALQSAQKQEIALRRQIARTTNLSRRKALQEQLIESQKEKKRLQIQEEAEKRREQIELLYELFKRQMTIREFNRQKQYQYGMAAMNMAAGIIGAFAQGIAQLGPIAGAIVGAVEAAAVAALGGVQMAMISAQSPPAFSQGSWDVGTTGPAILHGGEIVVPPTMADSIRAGNAVLGGGAGSGQVVNINVHGSVIDKKGFLKAMKEAANFGKFKLGPSGAY